MKEWEIALSLTNDILFISQLQTLMNSGTNSITKSSIQNIDLQRTPNVVTSIAPIEKRAVKLQLRDSVATEEQYQQLMKVSKTVAETGRVQDGSGDPVVDRKLAVGYLQVNSGKANEARNTFQKIMDTVSPVPLAAYLGYGTACAISGDLMESIKKFSMAIKEYSNSADAWKRRGQARAAQGNLSDAIEDLTQSSLLLQDDDTYMQRGLVYYKTNNFNRAIIDFEQVVKMDATCAAAWNQLGLCRTAVGRPWDVSI